MLSNISSMNQSFWNQQNSYNQSLYNLKKQVEMSHSQVAPGQASTRPAAPFRQYPITATDFRPIFQRMGPDAVANSQPGLTPEQREEFKAFGNRILTVFEANWRKDNVANAMLYLYSESQLATSGHMLSGTEYGPSLMAFNNALAGNANFITMSLRDKQLMYEEAIVMGGLIGLCYDQGIQGNPAMLSQAKELSRGALRYLGFDVR